jgi:hypothetical protein
MPKDPMNPRDPSLFQELMRTRWAIPTLVFAIAIIIIGLVFIA